MSRQDSYIYGNMRYPTSHQDKTCKFTEGVRCSPYDYHGRRIGIKCESCGHNPAVAKERLKNYCEKHGITLETEK